mgnify:CR=1 FL=1
MPRFPVLGLSLLLALASALPAEAAGFASVFGGRVPCVEQEGVQFCEGSVDRRVESFDGVPLDKIRRAGHRSCPRRVLDATAFPPRGLRL